MKNPEVQQSLFKELAAELPDQHRAEFFRVLHEAGIGPNDVELARLLRVLQLYKAYYETIPTAVQKAAGDIERVKQEIARLNSEARQTADAGMHLGSRVIEEAKGFHHDLTEIHEHVEEALNHSAQDLASRMAELLKSSIEQTVLLPFQCRLAELAESNLAFDETIVRSNQAAATLRQNSLLARRIHLGGYALGGLLIVASLTLVSWFFLHRWYEGRIEQERADMIERIEKNRAVLLELSKSQRTLELRQDPEHPHRKLLVMKDASGWQSTRNHGVIEFNE